MFQNFSGSSRRPRQVNLSGQNIDPFAATSWAPEASGTKKTLAAAQQERERRHQERERLNATKRLQRVWRGHRVRKALAESQRTTWDELEIQQAGQHSLQALAEQARLLIAFFDSSKLNDLARLDRLAERLLQNGRNNSEVHAVMAPYEPRLADMVLDSVSRAGADSRATKSPLRLLSAFYNPGERSEEELVKYYTVLAKLLNKDGPGDRPEALWEALAAPLVSSEAQNGWTGNVSAYIGLAFTILTRPSLSQEEHVLQSLASIIDVGVLDHAMMHDKSVATLSTMDPETRLWLLSHFIYLHNLRSKHSQEPTYIKALSTILSFSANDIFGRIDASQDSSDDMDDEVDGRNRPQPLPDFIRTQVVSLANKNSITGLLAKFDADYSQNQASSPDGDASLLASYALTLLRTFPTLGEEIRMWLYQSSVSVSTHAQIPAVKLFWTIMKSTRLFTAISGDPDPLVALNILRMTSKKAAGDSQNVADLSLDRDWRAILLFLELYSFALRFTDDEEFLSGGQPNVEDPTGYMSRSRESALPLGDVKLLTLFLKNLTFTMYYKAPELVRTGYEESTGNLSSLFGTAEYRRFGPSDRPPAPDTPKSTSEDFFGISGMTFDYVRNIANRVMQMLYERDSRRRFLPKDHWLMTTRFDMGAFIPAVVAEEERRRQITDMDEDAEREEVDPMDEDFEDVMMPMQRIGTRGNLGVSHSRQAVSMKELRKRAAAKAAAMVGPRLEILQHMPYVIPFRTRVEIFRQFTYQDQVRRRLGSADPDIWRMRSHQFPGDILGRHHARIRRNHVIKDAFHHFYPLGDGLKEPIQITFVDKFGSVEAGIDGGGVTKEFLTTATSEAFTPGISFVANDQNLLYPNPAILDQRKRLLKIGNYKEGTPDWNEDLNSILKMYEFLGRIIGKCLYEGILVDIGFAGFFLLKWALAGKTSSGSESRYQANINDLRDLDESLYQNLLKLKNYRGNVEDFALDFTIEDVVSQPGEPTQTITRDLLPNGSNTPVTNENRVLYISLVARHRLHTQPRLQTNAFLKGLGEMIQPSWLSMFNQIELQTLISGDMAEINVDDLRANTVYSGVYVIGDDGLEHETVRLFWEVMKELDEKDKGAVLKFVTSTPRAPLLGFGVLNPKFTIRDSSMDEKRLPSASTCINLLKLPQYRDKKTLREKLLYAVNSGAGFDLS